MKAKVFLLLAFLLVSLPCYVGANSSGWQPELRVCVMKNLKNASVTPNRDCAFFAGNKKIKLHGGKTVSVILLGESIEIDGERLAGKTWELRTDDPRELKTLMIKINSRTYRGGLRFLLKGDTLTAVNMVPVEEYLRGVVPEEMPPLWNKEAVKAQAVAARTFALRNRKRHEKDGYDLCNTTHCQVYGGQIKEHPNADMAIKETYGEVIFVTREGPIIEAPFHTDSGGMTESNEDLWGKAIPYLRSVKEIEEKTKPWSKTVSILEFEKKTRVNKVTKIELTALNIGKKDIDRTDSGRARNIRVIGQNDTKILSGALLRNLFSLNSTLFDVSIKRNLVEFKGYGVGHGVGMSQWGAKALAESGKNYKEILSHYYQKTYIGKLYLEKSSF